MTNMSCNHKYWCIINGEVNIHVLLMTNNYTDGVVVGKFQILSFQRTVIKGKAYSQFPQVLFC